jgi:DNA-binding transcriptional MerR regulator
MIYTVKQLASLAGISVRTLHYYDEVNLLKPSLIKENGYRYYGEEELLKLQQILFFKELEFRLEKIKEIMQLSTFDSLQALLDQENLLKLKKKRIERILTTIAKTIMSLKGGETMSNNDKFSAFNDPTYQKYKDEAEKRWGNTEAYKQSQERVSKMSREDLKRVKAEQQDIADTIAKLMLKGATFDSSDVQNQIDRFYTHLHAFYDPSYEMFKGLGRMYVGDPRFAAHYEEKAKGMATFMRDAMAFYAEKNDRDLLKPKKTKAY